MRPGDKAARSMTGLAIIVLLMLFIVFNALVIMQGLLNPFNSVRSASMSPEIKINDGVVKRPLDPQELQVGQVIVFPDPQDGSQHLVSRIVEIRQQNDQPLFVTKGDQSLFDDPYPVPAGNVEGVVSKRIPGLGPFIDYANSTYGFIVTVLLPSCIIVFYLIVRHRRKKRPACKRSSARPAIPTTSPGLVSLHPR
jgi:signal peptidase I